MAARPLLLRKAGLRAGLRSGAAASPGCPAPVAPQGGAKGSGYARGQLLRSAALAPVAPQGGA
ncbi:MULTISPECIES: hypothetical protein [unclassified Paenibacillus]|uniref:hypothetical protein n=1 Tax=unclassified Paenibacillus TaxID=185978 RepID=UPI00117C92AC|nr:MULTISPECIES: hypothetical protein [unclassified Paenibacillus]